MVYSNPSWINATNWTQKSELYQYNNPSVCTPNLTDRVQIWAK